MTLSLDSGCAESEFASLIVEVDRDGPDIVPEGECTGSSGLVDDGCGHDYAYRCASSEIDGGRVERTIELIWVDETSMQGTALTTPTLVACSAQAAGAAPSLILLALHAPDDVRKGGSILTRAAVRPVRFPTAALEAWSSASSAMVNRS